MTSARANRETGPRAHRVNPAPLRSALQAVTGGPGLSEVVPLGLPVQQKLLLRTLVEKFGGEVAASSLSRYLSHELGWTSPAPGAKMTDILWALQSLGAVDLEPTGEQDLIVRLLPAGAEFYT